MSDLKERFSNFVSRLWPKEPTEPERVFNKTQIQAGLMHLLNALAPEGSPTRHAYEDFYQALDLPENMSQSEMTDTMRNLLQHLIDRGAFEPGEVDLDWHPPLMTEKVISGIDKNDLGVNALYSIRFEQLQSRSAPPRQKPDLRIVPNDQPDPLQN